MVATTPTTSPIKLITLAEVARQLPSGLVQHTIMQSTNADRPVVRRDS